MNRFDSKMRKPMGSETSKLLDLVKKPLMATGMGYLYKMYTESNPAFQSNRDYMTFGGLLGASVLAADFTSEYLVPEFSKNAHLKSLQHTSLQGVLSGTGNTLAQYGYYDDNAVLENMSVGAVSSILSDMGSPYIKKLTGF